MEFESLSITPDSQGYKVKVTYRDNHDFVVTQERDYNPLLGDLEAMLIDIHEHIIETLNGSNNKSNRRGVQENAQTTSSSNSEG